MYSDRFRVDTGCFLDFFSILCSLALSLALASTKHSGTSPLLVAVRLHAYIFGFKERALQALRYVSKMPTSVTKS